MFIHTLRASTLVLLASLCMNGCGTVRSSYVPMHAHPGELIVGYQDGLNFSKDGLDVSQSDLPNAVACSPEASRLASRANMEEVTLDTLVFTGVVSMLAGTALSLASLAEGRESLRIPGVAVLGAGTLAAVVGGLFTPMITSDRLDAINVYNDALDLDERCLRP